MGMAELRVGVVGLGPIGLEVTRAIMTRRELRIVTAVDVSPALLGKRLDELVPGAPEDVIIVGSLDEALSAGRTEAVALTTTSRFAGIGSDLETAIKRRVHVVSTCEEMAAPAIDPRTWARLDDHAKHADVTLLGTGVNPGFVMDRLPLQLAGACISVQSVQVSGAIIVTTPQEMAVGDALRGAKMFDRVNVPVIGVVENLFAAYVSTAFKDTFAFGIIIVVLMFRPQGLFTRRIAKKV